MPVAAAVFAALAAVLHVLIFVMESVLWARPQVWRRFAVPNQSDADVLRPMAFNQGFYNLFLALGIFGGLIVGGAGGHAIVMFCCLCIVGAALVLVSGGSKYARAAAMQGSFALVALVLDAVL